MNILRKTELTGMKVLWLIFTPVLLLGTAFLFSPQISHAVGEPCDVNQAPVAVINPTNPTIKQSDNITFWARSSYDPDDQIIRRNRIRRLRNVAGAQTPLIYFWEAPELGKQGTSISFSITPQEPGEYIINLTASDHCASGTTSTTLIVEPISPVQPELQSQPIIAKLELPTNTLVDGDDIELFSMRITADNTGDIGFYKATFDITTNNTDVSNFVFKEYQADGVSGEVNLTNNSPREPDEIINFNTSRLNILFDTGTDGVNSGGEYRLISAGTSKVFKLFGTVANSASGSSVNIEFLADEAFPDFYPVSAGDIDADINDNFIWSDLHFGNSSTTATNTAEWFNGFSIFNSLEQLLSKEESPEPPQEEPEPPTDEEPEPPQEQPLPYRNPRLRGRLPIR